MVGPAPPLPPNSRPSATILVHHTTTKDVHGELERHEADGYRPKWCITYGSGQRSSADLILTNETGFHSLCLPEVGNKSLPRVLQKQAEQGYHLWHIGTRIRGRNVTRPAFSLLLKPIPPHLEHVYYLREGESDYLEHLETLSARNFTLVSHSFYYIDDQLFASSVYVRDRRLPLGVAIRRSPPRRWRSFYNLSLDEFASQLTRQANQSFYPTSVNSYQHPSGNESRFSLVFQESPPAAPEKWITWGLNETGVAEMLNSSRSWFKPELSLGYLHGDREEFYLQMVRKRLSDL